MNKHWKGPEMTTEEAVAKGAKLFANAEEALAKLSAEMPKVFAAVRDGGNLGGIECMTLTAECQIDIGRALHIIAQMHQKLTEKAQEKGIDLPAPRSGGGR